MHHLLPLDLRLLCRQDIQEDPLRPYLLQVLVSLDFPLIQEDLDIPEALSLPVHLCLPLVLAVPQFQDIPVHRRRLEIRASQFFQLHP